MIICLDQGGQGGEIVAYLKICLYMKFVLIISFSLNLYDKYSPTLWVEAESLH